jgi:DNA repair protein RAD50
LRSSSNGCGKTTIIEALRYAVTGSFPPGQTAGKGGNFVHDPRNVGHSTVKASVKLRFASTSGKDYVVTRAMELTQKKTGVTFKQLDGVLRFTDENTGMTAKNSHKVKKERGLSPPAPLFSPRSVASV